MGDSEHQGGNGGSRAGGEHGDILAPYSTPNDSAEQYLRPQRLDEFIGQPQIKKNLRVFIDAARERDDALDHVLLSGPPGLGKTTLATIMAAELGTTCRVTSAPAIEKPKDIAGILSTNEQRAVVFIDEIHRLRSAIEEMLYTAMEDYRIDWVVGQGPTARTIGIRLPAFTLVGATTKPGGISAPLTSRFGIPLRLDYYDDDMLAEIITRSAGILKVRVTEDAAQQLAQSSRGTPRIANRLLRRVRDFAQLSRAKTIGPGIVGESLEKLGIDPEGLDAQDRAILHCLVASNRGNPVGLQTISIAVSESVETIEEYYEPYLIRRGYIARTPRGRVATDAAFNLLGVERGTESKLF